MKPEYRTTRTIKTTPSGELMEAKKAYSQTILRKWLCRLKEEKSQKFPTRPDSESVQLVNANTPLISKEDAVRVLTKVAQASYDLLGKGKPIAAGISGAVYRMRVDGEQPGFLSDVVVKVVLEPRRAWLVSNEFDILEMLNSKSYRHAPRLIGRFGTIMGQFLVMEFIEGRTPPALHLLTMAQKVEALQALDELHRLKICHTDLHDGNLIITPHGKVVLIDFGRARFDAEKWRYIKERQNFLKDLYNV